MNENRHDPSDSSPSEPEPSPDQSPEPLPPGCMGLVMAGLTIGLGIGITYFLLESSSRTGTVLDAVGSYFGGVAIIVIAGITIPVAALLVYFFSTAWVRRRRMHAEMARVVDDE